MSEVPAFGTDIEAKCLGVQGLARLCIKYKTSLDYMETPSQKQGKENKSLTPRQKHEWKF